MMQKVSYQMASYLNGAGQGEKVQEHLRKCEKTSENNIQRHTFYDFLKFFTTFSNYVLVLSTTFSNCIQLSQTFYSEKIRERERERERD